MTGCDASRIGEMLGSEYKVERALNGEGVRIRAPHRISLLDLPRSVLEALSNCEIVELVEPDGRIVYFTRAWVRRALELAASKSNSG